jgi:hypothetical protein
MIRFFSTAIYYSRHDVMSFVVRFGKQNVSSSIVSEHTHAYRNTIIYILFELARIDDGDLTLGRATLRSHSFHGLDDCITFEYLAKDHVAAVQPADWRCCCCC